MIQTRNINDFKLRELHITQLEYSIVNTPTLASTHTLHSRHTHTPFTQDIHTPFTVIHTHPSLETHTHTHTHTHTVIHTPFTADTHPHCHPDTHTPFTGDTHPRWGRRVSPGSGGVHTAHHHPGRQCLPHSPPVH